MKTNSENASAPDHKATPSLVWAAGTAYDLFASLHVLHTPERFGLRPSWAAGVRSRLPSSERQTLEIAKSVISLPARWLWSLPAPRSAETALWALQQLEAGQRLDVLAQGAPLDSGILERLRVVAARRAWKAADLAALREFYQHHRTARPPSLEQVLDTWAHSSAFGEAYLAALQAYHAVFFAEEERHLRPALDIGLARAQALAQQTQLPDLLDQLSQGVRFTAEFTGNELVLSPSYWITPLVYVDQVGGERSFVVFGARPPSASLVPGEMVPDALLHGLKALADPTRLRILRLLAGSPLTQAQLARQLRLRAPTVLHHLSALRLAGLVHLTIDQGDERRYTARPEALPALFGELAQYLENPPSHGEEKE